MNVTPLHPPRHSSQPKDRTGAERQRRYREKRQRDASLSNPLINNNGVVTRDGVITVTLSLEQLDALASRIAHGPVTRYERYLASRIILDHLATMPDDAVVEMELLVEDL